MYNKTRIASVLFYILIIIDFISTKIGLSMGYYEMNPIMAEMFSLIGLSNTFILGIILIGLLTILIVIRAPTYSRKANNILFYTLLIASIFRIIVLISNFSLILKV